MTVQATTGAKERGKYKSEGHPEASSRNNEKDSWERLFRYGQRRVEEMGIGPEDVIPLIEEHRAEAASSKQ